MDARVVAQKIIHQLVNQISDLLSNSASLTSTLAHLEENRDDGGSTLSGAPDSVVSIERGASEISAPSRTPDGVALAAPGSIG